MKNDEEKLDAMIALLEGEGGHHLVEANEQETIITWLKELRETRAREAASQKRQVMRVQVKGLWEVCLASPFYGEQPKNPWVRDGAVQDRR